MPLEELLLLLLWEEKGRERGDPLEELLPLWEEKGRVRGRSQRQQQTNESN